jgi:tRNA (cmo5U34)-methyltransferase
MAQEIARARDRVFAEPTSAIGDFKFGKDVASVFDDMLERSVPFYAEVQRMIGEMATDFVRSGTTVYDFGCSTGSSMLTLHDRVPADVRFVGIDNSEEMLEQCRVKLVKSGFCRHYELRCDDLNAGAQVENASLALMVLTLQFIRPLKRECLMADIFRGLNDGGCLILVEKVLGEDSFFNRLFIQYYYEMKRKNGYSRTEIAQKREALENVLIPYRLLENRELLLQTGYRYVDVFFKWYNFCGMVAVK